MPIKRKDIDLEKLKLVRQTKYTLKKRLRAMDLGKVIKNSTFYR